MQVGRLRSLQYLSCGADESTSGRSERGHLHRLLNLAQMFALDVVHVADLRVHSGTSTVEMTDAERYAIDIHRHPDLERPSLGHIRETVSQDFGGTVFTNHLWSCQGILQEDPYRSCHGVLGNHPWVDTSVWGKQNDGSCIS